MKIGPIDNKPAALPPAAERKPAAATAASTGQESSTRVEISSAASVLSAALADPSFDAAKVDRIAQAIRDGKFKVNAEAIADKLIANAEELLGRRLN